MTAMGFLALGIALLMIIALAFDWLGPEVIFFIGLTAMLFLGIIDTDEALSGFSNKGMITVAALFIVSKGVENTGAMKRFAGFFFSKRRSRRLSWMMFRVMLPAGILSPFLNNTPIVMIFTPMVKKWAENLRLSPSKFLIPLSYATIFGGICTLIGTSTNLVVHGLMLDNGMEGYGMFELAKIGLPLMVIGFLYILFFGKHLLPDRKDIIESVGESPKEYVMELTVEKGCDLIGKTVKQGGLRSLKGVYLMEIERDGERISPVSAKDVIQEGDRLMFAGITSTVTDLLQIPGLRAVDESVFDKDFHSLTDHLVEVAVSESSPVLGKTVRKSNFRSEYNAAVVAVHRNGQRIQSKIGDIKLRAGDSLVLLTTQDFISQWRNSQDFILVSDLHEAPSKYHKKSSIALAILLFMIVGGVLGRYLPPVFGNQLGILQFAMLAAILMILFGCVDINRPRSLIQWNVLIVIAAAFGISKGLQNSGAAEFVAGGIVNGFSYFGPVGVLAGIALITVIFTELITNNAAAALMFPIALSAAQQLGVNPMPFLVAITVGASASFATPIGYQTNLIVQGPGGYRFKDYLKIGLPLSLIITVSSVFIIQLFWKF